MINRRLRLNNRRLLLINKRLLLNNKWLLLPEDSCSNHFSIGVKKVRCTFYTFYT